MDDDLLVMADAQAFRSWLSEETVDDCPVTQHDVSDRKWMATLPPSMFPFARVWLSALRAHGLVTPQQLIHRLRGRMQADVIDTMSALKGQGAGLRSAWLAWYPAWVDSEVARVLNVSGDDDDHPPPVAVGGDGVPPDVAEAARGLVELARRSHSGIVRWRIEDVRDSLSRLMDSKPSRNAVRKAAKLLIGSGRAEFKRTRRGDHPWAIVVFTGA